jgi:hypothetical protein
MKSPRLEDCCKKQNLEYLYFDMDSKTPCLESRQSIEAKSKQWWLNIACLKDEEVLKRRVDLDIDTWHYKARKSIEEFIDFINFMQKENVYIGCACGTYRTDFAVVLNSFFNPKAKYNCSNISFANYLKGFENLYHNLTQADKLKLGWSKDFDKHFISKLNKLKAF